MKLFESCFEYQKIEMAECVYSSISSPGTVMDVSIQTTSLTRSEFPLKGSLPIDTTSVHFSDRKTDIYETFINEEFREVDIKNVLRWTL